MRIAHIISFTVLSVAALALLVACSGDATTESAFTPAGLLEGKPTFVYLWNSP